MHLQITRFLQKFHATAILCMIFPGGIWSRTSSCIVADAYESVIWIATIRYILSVKRSFQVS